MAKILVIDDDAQMRRMIVRTLTEEGHEVLEAADGRAGIMQFLAHRPPLVITDILMPDKEGIETIRELRREAPGVAVLAISGGGFSAYLKMAEQLGASAALAKPFLGTTLIEVVNRLLAKSPNQQIGEGSASGRPE
jgi:DNA-binding response OmpR family regulator